MLHVEESGHGFPVVLLHGTPVAPGHFRPLAERLAASYRVALVHLPGYGRSKDAAPATMEQSQALLVEALRQRGVDEAHLIGFSTGAYRALFLAAHGLLGVRSIVGLGAVASFSHRRQELLMQARLVREGAVDARQYCEAISLSAHGSTNAAWREHVRAWPDATSSEALAREAELLAGAPDLQPVLPAISAPVLLRVGTLDVGAPPDTSREIAALLPRCKLEVVPDVAHALLLEDFEDTTAAIERFLAAS